MQPIPRSTSDYPYHDKILKKPQFSTHKIDFASFQFWYEEAKKSAKKVKMRPYN